MESVCHLDTVRKYFADCSGIGACTVPCDNTYLMMVPRPSHQVMLLNDDPLNRK